MDKYSGLNVEMSVAKLLHDWPQAVPVFIKYRMACVGCSMASFETLGGAAKIYGIAPEQFLDDLNQAIESRSEAGDPQKGKQQ